MDNLTLDELTEMFIGEDDNQEISSEKKEIKEEEIVYINKKKKDLTVIEQYRIKYQPEKYKLGKGKKKKKKLSAEEKLQKRIKMEEKKREKETKEIFKEYDKMKKHPKKYKKGLSKKEKQIMKYFKMEDGKKKKPKGKLAKLRHKENKFAKKNIINYFFIQELQARYDSVFEPKKYKKNPNKEYIKRMQKNAKNDTEDAKRVALLKTLEEEIIMHLTEDPLAFDNENRAVEFKEFMNKDKKKKEKKKDKKKHEKLDINRLII